MELQTDASSPNADFSLDKCFLEAVKLRLSDISDYFLEKELSL